jgi:2,3-bisphosphoglycerate-independent phosphoglycerate mutase
VKVLLLFLDGVGVGSKDPERNPIVRAELPVLKSLLGGSVFHRGASRSSGAVAEMRPVNATLGVAGLPQSGTGQAAIFTGVNAPKKIGRHFGPYPVSDLRPIIEQRNVFRRVRALGKSAAFANAFPRQFFEYTRSGTRRLTVTTMSTMMAGVPLLDADALRRNEGVSADLTRERWPELGYADIVSIPPAVAGSHLANLCRQHDFVLFEYWLTDHAGHKQDMAWAVEILERFDAFLGGVLDAMDHEGVTLLLISDHGNIEDLSTKSHTRNPVPLIVTGPRRTQLAGRIKNLTHITPAILALLS